MEMTSCWSQFMMDSAISTLEQHASRGGKEAAPTGQSSKSSSPSQSKNSEEISCFGKPSLPEDVADKKVQESMVIEESANLKGGYKLEEIPLVINEDTNITGQKITDLFAEDHEILEAKVISDSEENPKSKLLTDPGNGSTDKGSKAMNMMDDSINPEPAVLPENKTGKKDEEMTEQEKYFEEVFGDLEDIITLPELDATLLDQPLWSYGNRGASNDNKRGASSESFDSGNSKRPRKE